MAGMIADASDDDLARYAAAIKSEQDRRRVARNAEQQVADLNVAYLAATGTEPGQAWRQPTGAHDAYPVDWTVTHNGSTWVSLTPANVWEPGVSGWREVVEDDTAPPEWVPPTGAHDAYQKGDLVTFEGAVYESTIDGNTWSPTDYPAGWSLKGGEDGATGQEA